MTGSMKFD